MYVAEGEMRGNKGTFVAQDDYEDEAEATMALRHCYKVLRTESTRVKMATKVTDPEIEEDILAILNRDRKGYESYNLDGDKWFIEFFAIPKRT